MSYGKDAAEYSLSRDTRVGSSFLEAINELENSLAGDTSTGTNKFPKKILLKEFENCFSDALVFFRESSSNASEALGDTKVTGLLDGYSCFDNKFQCFCRKAFIVDAEGESSVIESLYVRLDVTTATNKKPGRKRKRLRK